MALSSCAVLAASGRLDVLVTSQSRVYSRDGARRPLTVQASSLVKSLVLGAAATAAVGAVIALRVNQKQHDSPQSLLQQSGQRRQRRRQQEQQQEGGSGGWLTLPRPNSLGLGWALHDKDKQLAQQVQDIEQQRQREAERELARWDERWRLRSRPLSELRALAARHRIAGRSRMRKQELVAALEAELGFAPPPGGAAQLAAAQRPRDEP